MTSGKDLQQSIIENDNRNLELLKKLRGQGVSLTERRSVEHHFWAPGQEKAALLARELHKREYLILMLAPRPGSDSNAQWWTIEAGISRSPNQAGSHEVTEELVMLAARFDAIYDGWGTLI